MRESLVSINEKLEGLRDLLVAGFWIQLKRENYPRRRTGINPRGSLREDLKVTTLSYSSPLQIVMDIAPAAASCLAAARGVVYIMNRWEDWRVRHARSNYEVAALKLLRDELPRVEDMSSVDMPRVSLEAMLPSSEENTSAARVTSRIEAVHLDEAAS
jgi:hypothetical protein